MPPEKEQKYPEPNIFGSMASQGFYLLCHVKSIELSEIEISAMAEDLRPCLCYAERRARGFLPCEDSRRCSRD